MHFWEANPIKTLLCFVVLLCFFLPTSFLLNCDFFLPGDVFHFLKNIKKFISASISLWHKWLTILWLYDNTTKPEIQSQKNGISKSYSIINIFVFSLIVSPANHSQAEYAPHKLCLHLVEPFWVLWHVAFAKFQPILRLDLLTLWESILNALHMYHAISLAAGRMWFEFVESLVLSFGGVPVYLKTEQKNHKGALRQFEWTVGIKWLRNEKTENFKKKIVAAGCEEVRS